MCVCVCVRNQIRLWVSVEGWDSVGDGVCVGGGSVGVGINDVCHDNMFSFLLLSRCMIPKKQILNQEGGGSDLYLREESVCYCGIRIIPQQQYNGRQTPVAVTVSRFIRDTNIQEEDKWWSGSKLQCAVLFRVGHFWLEQGVRVFYLHYFKELSE